jgi:hypothetical protein
LKLQINGDHGKIKHSHISYICKTVILLPLYTCFLVVEATKSVLFGRSKIFFFMLMVLGHPEK